MWYAEYCPRGTGLSYSSLNGNAYTFFAFDRKADRDAWVEAHEYDGCEYVAAKTTYKTIRTVLGAGFIVDEIAYEDEYPLRDHDALRCYRRKEWMH